jgi:hypothetical protein
VSDRPVVFVLYASFALVESILPVAVELHKRGNPLQIVQLASNANKHIRSHKFYREIFERMAVYRDFSRPYLFGSKIINALAFVFFLLRLRIFHGRIIFIHRIKQQRRVDRLLSRLLQIFGRCYAFPPNQGVVTRNRAKWMIRENERIITEVRRGSGRIEEVSPEMFVSRATSPGKRAPTQPMLIFTEQEEKVFRDVLRSRDHIINIGIPRLYTSWPDQIAGYLEEYLMLERSQLGIGKNERIVTLAMTYINEPWFKHPDVPEEFVREILKSMRRHMQDACLVVKAKPNMLADIRKFCERINDPCLRVSICPLPVLARGSALGIVVASAAVYEFLFSGVPTIDLLDAPSQLSPVLGWWDGIPGIYKASSARELDRLIESAASKKLAVPDRGSLVNYFGHDDLAFARFLEDA